MNHVTQATVADLLDRYATLPRQHKLVLRAKSLIGIPTSKATFLACMIRTGTRGLDGRGWSTGSLNPILDHLVALNLLDVQFACPLRLLHPITIDAAAAADAAMVLEAVRATVKLTNTSLYYADMRAHKRELRVRLRLAVYANDVAEFIATRDRYDKTCAPERAIDQLGTQFADVPLDDDWLIGRAAALQRAVLEARLEQVLAGGAALPDPRRLIEHHRARGDSTVSAQMLPVKLRRDLLAARVPDLAEGLAALPADEPLAGLLLAGAAAFLTGANEAALKHYRAGLKLHRKQSGRRKQFLDGEHGILFLMALLRAGDAERLGEMQACLDSALPGQRSGLLALQAILWLVQGLDGKARELLRQAQALKQTAPLTVACTMLAVHVVEHDASPGHVADLAARFAQTRETLPLAARIHAEILAAVAPDPQYARFLADTGRGFGVAFTQLVALGPPWQRALTALGGLLHPGAAQPGLAAPRKTRRLAWFIAPGTWDVEAVEQTARGADGWTDGRPVAPKRLVLRDPRFDYLTEQDRAAVRGVRTEMSSWDGSSDYYFDPRRTIPALVGHQAVYDASRRAQRLELLAGTPELVVTECPGGFHVALSHHAEAPTLFVEPETPSRWRVTEFTEKLLPVQAILGRDGLTVPADARDQLVAMVMRGDPALPIRAEIAALGRAALAGDPAPVVQLVPLEGALKVSLVVRPFGADGPAWVAGMGGRSVLAGTGVEQRRATRDLAGELAARQALVAACPTLRDRGGADGHELVLDDLEGQLEFLLELQAAAAAVEWPEGRRMQVSAVAAGRMKLRVGQDRGWFTVAGSVEIDADDVVDMRFLLDRLERVTGRFVKLEDGRFVALTRQLQAQLGRLAAVSETTKEGARVHALGAPALRDVLEEAGEVKAVAAWTKHVGRIRAAEGFVPAVPAGLTADLRDYQVEGFVWMSRLARWGAGACLADDMGLGKTVQAIAVMLDRAAEGPCLVVAPTSVCANWMAELQRFAPTLTPHRLSAAPDRAALVAGLGPRDVLVCSYGLLHSEAALLGATTWQTAVLDEAQAIKNAGTKRAQASVGLQAGFRLALTGTPVENYLDELWSLFNFVNPGLLGSREGFQKRFGVPIERDRSVPARQALRALVRPFLLRRTKAAVLSELPSKTEQTVLVEMGAAERAFYEALRQRALEAIAALSGSPGARKIHILAEITRLRRACCNPALIDAAAGVGSAKLEALLALVEDLTRNRHKALVFSQFVGHLALVRAALDARGVRYEYLDGATPAAERERRVAAFQAGSADLFLISLRAGGTGLNLTAADYVVHLDPWWNPAVEDQASDRAHRIGQKRPVTIYRLIMQDSIEDKIVSLHRDKREMAWDLLEGAEASGRLSEAQLLDLLNG